jgi:hypothetical protein
MDAEYERLFNASRDAFQKARDAFDRHPTVGSPEWTHWTNCLETAHRANVAFQKLLESRITNLNRRMDSSRTD